MISVLSVPFYDKDIRSAVSDVMAGIMSGTSTAQNFCISTTGAHGLVEAGKDALFRQVLLDFYLNLPDGMPVVWVGRFKGASSMRRCYGPDFFEALLRATADKPINHFFCGGKKGVAESLKHAVSEKFVNHRVTGVYFPPFREMTDAEMQELGQQIIDSNAHIVWIGISTPKQERFARRLGDFTRTDFIITVGAAFDFHTGRLKQAPKWMQKAGLEWFFRLLAEPGRLYRRYFEVVPKFIWLNIKEFLHICGLKIRGK
jgi:N-acetylglucosaminyldiphosphoundecaprenol N-acetyl-beta-D-mannosaminyltransferase